MIPNVELRVAGQPVGGWQDVRLSRSMEDLAWSFNLTVFDKWAETRPSVATFPFDEGAGIEVLVDDVVALTGYIDEINVTYTADSHRVVLSGRSKAGDLIDCSPAGRKKWRNAPLLTIAKDLLNPFGITPTVGNIPSDFTKPFDVFSIEEGEKVFDTLERLANYRSVFMTSDAQGGVKFTQASTERAPATLQFGDSRILQASRRGKWSDRYSQYVVKAQTKGTDVWSGDQAAKGVALITDDVVTRYRPLVILPDGQGYKADLERRAKWERNVRAGRSKRIEYTVHGWYEHEAPGASLWTPNKLVRVIDKFTNVDDDLLIARVELMLGNSTGDRAGLELVHPSAFDILKPPKPKPKGGGDFFGF